METKKFNNKIVVRLDKGEEILTSLTSVVNEYDIQLASVMAIGASNHVTIGLFNVQEKNIIQVQLKKI